ncbi:hypothetical protein BC374_10035 [Ensifer sp. LC13]|nr:hypothetical protein BBX50_09970 [Ensifer sp. LC11]OCO99480.1 hypothetical protein BC374_10035 [Ensifer sp. LC13]OCP14434.1 hypothetical protein BC362_03865 [Ensifer sp. LC14]OCP29681.1 hypothetical protein BC364_07640 [Ensifer sp. LC499]
MPDDRGMNLNETVNGEDFSGIRKTYVITPQAAGDYALPAIVIPFGYAAVPGQTSQGKVTVPSLTITVAAVPGGAGGTSGVTAGEMTITQTFDRDLAGLHTGDALVRTIIIRAVGLAPMMIPEPSFDAPAGVQVYRHDPALSEERTPRGETTAGLRKDTATYVFTQPGKFSLPAIALQWFNPASGKTETAEAEAAELTIAAAPATETALAPPAAPPAEEPFDWLWWTSITAAVLAFALLLQLAANLAGRLETWLDTALTRRARSEATAFRHVLDACREHDPARLETALDGWSRKAGNLPLSRWLDRFADAQTRRAFADYRRSRYGTARSDHGTPDLARLRTGLKASRQRWLVEASGDGNGSASELPALNPALDIRPRANF